MNHENNFSTRIQSSETSVECFQKGVVDSLVFVLFSNYSSLDYTAGTYFRIDNNWNTLKYRTQNLIIERFVVG